MDETRDSFIVRFFRMESSSGILLFLAAILAIIVANSPLSTAYEQLIKMPFSIKLGHIGLQKPLLLWINDGLMAIFFFLVGLELKREVIEGELSSIKQVALPGIGAIGGMVIPALIYLAFNHHDSFASRGWAIPAATDIAFALGVLSLLGSKVPTSIKVFLTSLAIFDDIGAILIIAFFYTDQLSITALIIAGFCIIVLFLLNRFNVMARSLYIVVGIVMWTALLKSGVHATLAGVILALFIPIKSPKEPKFSPLKRLEHDLHFAVAFIILPIFAFANSGVNLKEAGSDAFLHPVPVGVLLGLFVGKQLGVFGSCWLAIKLKIADKPSGVTWGTLYGTAVLCGIGFTMSLFIGSLAFDDNSVTRLFDERTGIILGSVFSGIVGYLIIRHSLRKKTDTL